MRQSEKTSICSKRTRVRSSSHIKTAVAQMVGVNVRLPAADQLKNRPAVPQQGWKKVPKVTFNLKRARGSIKTRLVGDSFLVSGFGSCFMSIWVWLVYSIDDCFCGLLRQRQGALGAVNMGGLQKLRSISVQLPPSTRAMLWVDECVSFRGSSR